MFESRGIQICEEAVKALKSVSNHYHSVQHLDVTVSNTYVVIHGFLCHYF